MARARKLHQHRQAAAHVGEEDVEALEREVICRAACGHGPQHERLQHGERPQQLAALVRHDGGRKGLVHGARGAGGEEGGVAKELREAPAWRSERAHVRAKRCGAQENGRGEVRTARGCRRWRAGG